MKATVVKQKFRSERNALYFDGLRVLAYEEDISVFDALNEAKVHGQVITEVEEFVINASCDEWNKHGNDFPMLLEELNQWDLLDKE